jgi:hypothetical protein
MVAIAAKILGEELLVAGDDPLMRPSDHLNAPLATIEKKASRYQVTSPRYSRSGGAVGKVANRNPL